MVVGLAFLGGLARERSLASAALLFLVLVDEIEGLVFLSLGIVLHRVELFLAAQDALFPAVVFVAAAVTLARAWRPRRDAAALVAVEALELSTLSERIGGFAPAQATATPGATATSPYGR